MRIRILTASFLLLLALGLLAESTQAGMVRMAKRYSVLDLQGGYSSPVGTYDGIGPISFRYEEGKAFSADADGVFDPSYHLGLSYGQLRMNHILYTVGFRYTNINDLSTIVTVDGDSVRFKGVDPVYRQLDLDVNCNFLFTNIAKTSLAPYVGLGLRAGLTTVGGEGYATEAELNIATAVNAGVEFRLWQARKGLPFVTLAPAGSYEFYSSGNRPRFFNIGLGLKYYYRM